MPCEPVCGNLDPRLEEAETRGHAPPKMSNFFDKLPDELLVHVFAQLEPEFLLKSKVVCRRWSRIISDDLCWKEAFIRMWRTVPFKRLSHTWRGEYSLRTNLLRVYQSAQYSNITFDPRAGLVDQIFINFEHSKLVVGSCESGLLVSCDPQTGSVNRDVLNCSEAPQEHQPVSVLKITASKVIVGHERGMISVVSNYKDGGSGASFRSFPSRHRDAVVCMETITSRNGTESILVSASKDMTVKIWDFASGDCCRTLQLSNIPRALHVDFLKNRIIVKTAKDLQLFNVDFSNLVPEFGPPASASLGQTIVLNEERDTLLSCFLVDEYSGVAFVPVEASVVAFNLKTARRIGELKMPRNITALTWDNDVIIYENSSGVSVRKRVCLVIAGDELGNLQMWDCRELVDLVEFETESLSAISEKFSQLRPTLKLKAHVGSLKAIEIDPFKITTASLDGYIKIWDVLSGKCIRTLHSRFSRHQINRRRSDANIQQLDDVNERKSIRHIVGSFHKLVATVGNEVKVWNFDPQNQLASFKKLAKKKKVARKILGRRPPPSPRTQLQFDAKQDVKESNKLLRLEHEQRAQREKFASKLNPKGMTEEEMLSYALMLSAQDQNVLAVETAPEIISPYFETAVPYSENLIDPVQQVPYAAPSLSDYPPLMPGGAGPSTPISIAPSSRRTPSGAKWFSPPPRTRKVSLSDFLGTSADDVATTGRHRDEDDALNEDDSYEVDEDDSWLYTKSRAVDIGQGNVHTASRSSVNTQMEDADLAYALQLSLQDQ